MFETTGASRLSTGLLLTMAITAGASVANLYYNQPMLGLIADRFHVGGEISVIAMATQLGYAAGLLLLVPLGDRVDRRGLILWQCGALIVALVACALAPSLLLLAVASLAIGVASTIAQQVVPFAADLAEPAQRGRTVGTVMSGLLCGILLARTLSGFVGAAFGWREMFWLGAGLAVLMTLLLAVMLPHSTPKTTMSYPKLLRSLGYLVAEHPTLQRASMIQACLFGAFSVFWSTLALLLQGPPYHRGAAVAGLFGIVGLVGVGAASLAGRLADRRGPRGGVGIGILLVIASFAAFGLLPSMMGLVIGVILLDLGVQMAMVSNQTLIFALGEATRARLNTIYVTALFLGGAVGSGAASVAWERGGWPAVSVLGAALAVIAIGIHLWDRAAATSVTTAVQSPRRG